MKPLLSLLALVATIALAGTEISGGGNAVVCYDQNETIIRAEFFDLFEGGAQYNASIQRSDVPWQTQLNQKVAQLELQMKPSKHFFELGNHGSFPLKWSHDFTWSILSAVKQLQFLQSGVALGPIEDSNHYLVPRNCSIQRLAFYDSDLGKLFVDKDIFDALPETDKAALFLHEGIYKYLRGLNYKDSRLTRAIVADLYLNPSPQHVYASLENIKTRVYCKTTEGPLTSFYVVAENLERYTVHKFQFNWISGVPMQHLAQSYQVNGYGSNRDLFDVLLQKPGVNPSDGYFALYVDTSLGFSFPFSFGHSKTHNGGLSITFSPARDSRLYFEVTKDIPFKCTAYDKDNLGQD